MASAAGRSGWMVALGMLTVAALGARGARADDEREVAQRLAELSRRWAGSRCVLRVPIEIKRKPTDDGGFQSPLYTVPQLKRRFSNGASRMWVSDRKALAPLLVGDAVPAGTELVAEGWKLLYPKDNDGAYLALRFVGAPVEARFFFISGMKTIGVGPGIDKVEEFLRFDILQVSSAGERLVPPPPVAPTPARSASTVPESEPAGEPELRLLGVGVEPTRLAAGGELAITVAYELLGAGCQVGERREIRRGEAVLQRFDDGFARAPATHSSRKPVTVPTGAAPGVYSARVEVSCGARRIEASALFEIE